MSIQVASFHYENPLKGHFPETFFKEITADPGIYFMLSETRHILYIGKAKNLKARLQSYPRAKPGSAPEHIIEMLENVRHIHWQTFSTEDEALRKESELLHALAPPFNIAQTEPEHHLFIGTRSPSPARIDFQLSSHDWMKDTGYRIHGCYQHRSKVKRGYTALIRLLFAAQFAGRRFSYPSRIARASPPWLHSMAIRPEWLEPLHDFLDGKSTALLTELFDALLLNESIPAFMRPSLQDDLQCVRQFFEIGPRATFELRKRHRLKTRTLDQNRLNTLIARELERRHPVLKARCRDR